MPLITDKSRKWFIASVTLISIPALVINYIGQKEHNRSDADAGIAFGGEKIRDSEVELAKNELQMLNQRLPGGPPNLSIGAIVFGQPFVSDEQEQQNRVYLGSQFMMEMERQPELFAVLKREAARNGIAYDRDRVEGVITNELRLTDENVQGLAGALRAPIASLLAIRAMGENAAQAIKITRPELQSAIAREHQLLDVRAWFFEASAFAALGTSPTTLATTRGGGSELFDKFGTAIPGRPTVENPFGFGYLQPDRLRLEYLTLSNGKLLRAVQNKSPSATPTAQLAHDWEVEARTYHLAHPEEFQKEETKPNPFPINGNPTITVKTTQPFETSKDAILAKLYRQRAGALRQSVLRKLSTIMGADYKAWVETPIKASSLGVPYNSPEYLQKLAEKVQADLGVRPAVTSLGTRYLSGDELRALPDVGSARLEQGDTLGEYLVRQSKPLMRSTVKNGLDPLELYEPSPAFTGDSEDVYVARVTDALPERTPSESEVAEDLRRDTNAMKTQAAAVAGVEAYGRPGASNAGLTPRVISIPALHLVTDVPADLGLSLASRNKFVEESFDLLRNGDAVAHPRAVISLPADHKVALVELNGVRASVLQENASDVELNKLQRNHAQLMDGFLMGYFSSQPILERTQWKSFRASRS